MYLTVYVVQYYLKLKKKKKKKKKKKIPCKNNKN